MRIFPELTAIRRAAVIALIAAAAAAVVVVSTALPVDASVSSGAGTNAIATTSRIADPSITRLEGVDRFSASAAISEANFVPGVVTVYVANGINFPDALSGAPVAAKNGSPILLVTADAIPDPVRGELERLNPENIVVLGGVNSVSQTVESALAAYVANPGKVTRLAGADRFSASAAISSANFDPNVATVYVASGLNFPDALSGAPVAAKESAPVLLVTVDDIPRSVVSELDRLNPAKIVVLGGINSISEAVANSLSEHTATKDRADVTRLAGADRFSASAEISARSFSVDTPIVYIANGLKFPDALSGAPVAGRANAPVLLVTNDAIPESIATELRRLNPERIVVLGGSQSVSIAVEDELASNIVSRTFTATPAPTISGAAEVGELLSADPGTWAPSPVGLTYQWSRGGVAIGGATERMYRLIAADAGTSITVSVTATRSGYVTVTTTSIAKLVVGGTFTATPVPTIAGEAEVGEVLSVDLGTWAPSPTAVSYQWSRGGVAIGGATERSYRLVAADAGAIITATATGSRAGYPDTSRTSAAVTVAHCGLITSDSTWSSGRHYLSCTVTVAADTTLTVAPGAVVLLDSRSDLTVLGELEAHATPDSPIVFTSRADPVFEPAFTAYSAESSIFQLGAGYAGRLDLSGITLAYGSLSFGDGSVVDSDIRGNVRIEPSYGYNEGHPIFARNVVSARMTTNYPGLMVTDAPDVTGIALTGTDRNTFVGSPLQRSVGFQGVASVPAGKEYILGPGGGISAYVGLPLGSGMVRLLPGTLTRGMVEAHNLVAEGTDADPVIFAGYHSMQYGGDVFSSVVPGKDFTGSALHATDGSDITLRHVLVTGIETVFARTANASDTVSAITISDSTIQGTLNLEHVASPVVERTSLHGRFSECASPESGCAAVVALSIRSVPDITGIKLAGPDANSFTGSAAERSVSLDGAGIPSGSSYELTNESGVSVFLAWPLNVGGTLDLAPGTIVNGTVDVTGTVHANGTVSDPVYLGGGAFGGDVGSGCINCRQPDPAMIVGGVGSTFNYTVFAFADVGIHVREFSLVTIENSKFVSTDQAIMVDGAGSADIGTSYFYDSLPCVPPWDSTVVVLNTWFGTTGGPGSNIDLSSLGGVVGDLAGSAPLGAAYSDSAATLALSAKIGANSIPWAIYECSIGIENPVQIRFPMTPVRLLVSPVSEWRPEIIEVADPRPGD
ncbi:putative cell wall binding repeat protein [Glaciihabitans tibetensis]|uniref:Putative cell wall binding repeat protein n=1 Tax=Glaciihabitans tibetensis TaxID=1266600 RepID=A0A2T0VGM0_9MICO|nr:cell wall-binding repeat-containing protein [Glaciihabitans tibetensis]PRY69349.1 putative cell wall binding repeat protein [Glaciihabitans tibetensis]